MIIGRRSATHFRTSLFLIACLVTPALYAEVKLPALISDHMVVQADAEVPIWGWAR
jgi:sialate O-acetylesterase